MTLPLDLPTAPRSGALLDACETLTRLAGLPRLTLSLRATPGAGLLRHARALAASAGRATVELDATSCAHGLAAALERGSPEAAWIAVEPSTWNQSAQRELAQALRERRADWVLAVQTLDPERERESGRLEADLFYGLNARSCRIPPVAEWGAELAPQAEALLGRLALELRPGAEAPRLRPDAASDLAGREWPGDRLELEARLTSALLRADGPAIEAGDLEDVAAALPTAPPRSLRDAERELIRSALAAEGGNRSRAARRLGLGRSTLYAKLDAHGLR